MASKKRVERPNLGGTLRPYAETPRRRFLYTDLTQSEYDKLREYCVKNQISLSQVLADLVLEDAAKPKPQKRSKVVVNLKLEFTPEEQDRLQLLARLRDKASVEELVREVLEPDLKLQKLHSSLETKQVRFYLSEEEHERVTSHIASTGMSVRNYAAMLVVRQIQKTNQKHKK